MKKYKLPLHDSSEIVFRTLTADESDRFYSALTSENPDIEEYVFNVITDKQYDVSKLNAGIILVVISACLKLSGAITKKEEVPLSIRSARSAVADSLYYIMYKAIVLAQPSYKMKDLKELSFKELMEEFAFSEYVLEKTVIDVDKLEEVMGRDTNKEEFKPKKGIKSVTPEELNAIKDYFKENERDGQFIDDRY